MNRLIVLSISLLRFQEPLDFFAVRHGVLRATLGDDQRAGGRCEPERIFKRLSLCKSHGERACEPVPRSHGIDRVYLKGGYVANILIGRVNDALLPQLDESDTDASLPEYTRRLISGPDVINSHPGQYLGF